MRISGKDIYIAYGDTGSLSLRFSEPIQDATFKMHLSTGVSIDGVINDKYVTFSFAAENRPNEYFYDIKMYGSANTTTTLIRKALFKIEETAEGVLTGHASYSGQNPEVGT